MYNIVTYAPGIGPIRSAIARSLPAARRIMKDMERTYGPGYHYRIKDTSNGTVLFES